MTRRTFFSLPPEAGAGRIDRSPMHVVVLTAFLVALTLADLAPAVGQRWLVAPALALYISAAAALGAFRTAMSLRALARTGGASTGRTYHRLAVVARVWLVAGLAAVVTAGYGRWVLDDLGLAGVPLAWEAALLAPFFLALLLTWLLEYPLYRAVRLRQAAEAPAPRPVWGLGEYLSYNLRHQVLFVAVPVGLILLAGDGLQLLAPVLPERLAEPVVLGGSIAASVGVFLIAPVLIVRIWRTARLPDSDLRRELEALCRTLGLRYRQLLVWRSGGALANAGVMGLIGRVRYILLSDALLANLPPAGVRAVFAHEAAHIVAHHLFYALLFAVSSVVLCGAAGDAAAALAGGPWWMGQLVALPLLGLVWGVGFGWISRRFERQSDVWAAWLSGEGEPRPDGAIPADGAAIFSRSLQAVASLNGHSPRQWNWRHGSIASRVAYVMWLGSTGGRRQDIDAVVRRIKIALWLAVAASAAVLAVQLA